MESSFNYLNVSEITYGCNIRPFKQQIDTCLRFSLLPNVAGSKFDKNFLLSGIIDDSGGPPVQLKITLNKQHKGLNNWKGVYLCLVSSDIQSGGDMLKRLRKTMGV